MGSRPSLKDTLTANILPKVLGYSHFGESNLNLCFPKNSRIRSLTKVIFIDMRINPTGDSV